VCGIFTTSLSDEPLQEVIGNDADIDTYMLGEWNRFRSGHRLHIVRMLAVRVRISRLIDFLKRSV
jgi:hypothetical protein